MKIQALALIAFGGLVLMSAASQARPERMCPMIYRPVCAIDRFHHRKTFGNRCEAESADAHVIYEGVCHRRHG